VLSILLVPPSWAELERRIRGRGTETPETIELRLENARRELEFADRYTRCVVNDDAARAVGEIQAMVAEVLG